jgi:hypothetical protein
MVKIKMDKAPKPTLTSAHVYEAHKLKRLAGEEKLLSPADLVTHAVADAVHQMPKQGRKDKEDEKLGMEMKGVKDAEKKPRKPRAKKVEHKEEEAAQAGDEKEKKPRKPRAKKEAKEDVISHVVEEAKVVRAAAEKSEKAIRKARFEKGSQEAKDYMARMRAMRKKKEDK